MFSEVRQELLLEMQTEMSQRILCRELSENAPEWLYERLGAITVELYRRTIDKNPLELAQERLNIAYLEFQSAINERLSKYHTAS